MDSEGEGNLPPLGDHLKHEETILHRTSEITHRTRLPHDRDYSYRNNLQQRKPGITHSKEVLVLSGHHQRHGFSVGVDITDQGAQRGGQGGQGGTPC